MRNLLLSGVKTWTRAVEAENRPLQQPTTGWCKTLRPRTRAYIAIGRLSITVTSFWIDLVCIRRSRIWIIFKPDVPPSLPPVPVGYSAIQSYALLHKTCAKRQLWVILKSTNLVHVCIRRDFDCAIRGFKRNTVSSCLRGWC